MYSLENKLKNIKLQIEQIDNKRFELKSEEFYVMMALYHPEIKRYGKYQGCNTKIDCECSICGHKWQASPHHLTWKNKSGCPKCAGNVAPTSEEIKEKLLSKYSNMIILTDKIKLRKSMLYQFEGSDIVYSNYPSSLLRDNFKQFSILWNTETYKRELSKVNQDIECVSEFLGSMTKITHYCKIHKHEFQIDPLHALRGQGCNDCKLKKIGDSHRKTTQQFIKELSEITNKIKLVDEYHGNKVPVKFECLECGHQWYAIPYAILNHYSCPACNRSRGETYISDFLSKNHIKFIREYRIDDCRDKRPLPFDFAVVDQNNTLKFLIEYQGKQHYEPSQFGNISLERAKENLKECQRRDKIKYNYCLANNIDLLTISYKQFHHIDEIITNKLVNMNMLIA